MTSTSRKRIGEALLEAGLINELQLRSALADQKRWGNRLGKTLVKLGFIEEGPLMRQLSKLMGLPLAEITGREISSEVLALIPPDLAEKFRCVPLFVDDGYLYVGMEEPADVATLDALHFRTGMEVCPVLIGFRPLDEALRGHYGIGLEGDSTLDPGAGETFEIGAGEGGPVGPDCLLHGDEDLALESDGGDDTAEFQIGPDDEDGAASQKPRDVPTRHILQALTQTLIAKGIITRDELFEQLKKIGDRDEG